MVSALGDRASAGTVDQASTAGIVVIAVPWDRVPDAVQGLAWSSQIVIDATNDFDPSDLEGRTSSEIVVDLVGGAPVVKAPNTLAAGVLGSDPHEAGGQRVLFLSGDDIDAKSEVIALFQDAGPRVALIVGAVGLEEEHCEGHETGRRCSAAGRSARGCRVGRGVVTRDSRFRRVRKSSRIAEHHADTLISLVGGSP